MEVGCHMDEKAARGVGSDPLHLLAIVVWFAASLYPGPAHAALGDSVDSLAADREALQSLRHSTSSHPAFTVHEMDSGSLQVREYVSPAGLVFGLAWDGLIHPDLEQLLGSHAGEYRDSLALTPRMAGDRSVRVSTGHIVVEKWGHMRNLRGRAYIPTLFPPGATADDIR